ncbi:MAG TPA: hypothetical protein VF589_04920 [Allosphingosinicella sp.]|jgi:hypothetical protein
MIDVVDLASLDGKPVSAGDFITVGGFSGGVFEARSSSSVLEASKVTLRFLPRPFTANLTVWDHVWDAETEKGATNPGGKHGDTITIDGHQITLVSSAPTGQQVQIGIGATDALKAADLAEKIMSYVNVNSVLIGVRMRGTTLLRCSANDWGQRFVGGVASPVAVSVSSTDAHPPFTWDVTHLSDPSEGSSVRFGDQPTDVLTFKAPPVIGANREIAIGATPSATAQNFKKYINERSETLDLTASGEVTDAAKGMDITLTPSSFAGLARLRNFVKGGLNVTNAGVVTPKPPECDLFVVQAMGAAAADKLGAIYRPSTASPTVVNVRVSVERDGTLHPSFWDLKGERGHDGDYIQPRMNAMFDAAHFLGCRIELRAGANYDLTRGDGYTNRTQMDAIRFRNISLYGNGATISNRNDIKRSATPSTPGEAGEQNSIFYFGVGHPAFDSDVPFARIVAAAKGDTYVELVLLNTGSYFRVGDVIPIMTVAGRSARTVWHPVAREFYKIVHIDGKILHLDRGLASDYPLNSRVALWMGHYDSTIRQDIFIADNPRVRDLSLYSPYGGAMTRSQAYNVDFEFDLLEAYYGVFINAMNGHVKVKKVRAKKKACDLAHNSQGVTVDMDEVEWWPNDTSDDAPMMHFAENSRDFVITCKLLRCMNSADEPDFPGPQIINGTDGARGIIKLGMSIVEKMLNGVTEKGDWATATAYQINDIVAVGSKKYVARKAHTSSADFDAKEELNWAPQVRRQFFTLLHKDSLRGEAPHHFTDLDLDLGQVFYGDAPGALVRIHKNTVNPLLGPKRIRVSGGRFNGAEPLVNLGAHVEGDDCSIAEGVHIPGRLRVDGNGGVYGGHFTQGYSGESVGAPTRVAISSDMTPQLTKRVVRSIGINSTDTANTYAPGTLILPPGTLGQDGDALELTIAYETSTGAGSKNIQLFGQSTGAAVQLAAILLPANAVALGEAVFSLRRAAIGELFASVFDRQGNAPPQAGMRVLPNLPVLNVNTDPNLDVDTITLSVRIFIGAASGGFIIPRVLTWRPLLSWHV